MRQLRHESIPIRSLSGDPVGVLRGSLLSFRLVVGSTLLLWVALAAGCAQLPRWNLGWGKDRWQSDPGGTLSVPQAGPVVKIQTRRSSVSLHVGQPPLLGARVEARIDDGAWNVLSIDAQSGLSSLDTSREGNYELRPALMNTDSLKDDSLPKDAPSLAQGAATLRLRVDRQGPNIGVQVEVSDPPGSRWNSALSVRWNVEDRTGVAQVRVEFSDDAGSTWRPLGSTAPAVGSYRWSFAPGSLRQHLLRVSALDGVGNRSTDVFPLDPDELAQQQARRSLDLGRNSGDPNRAPSQLAGSEPQPSADRTTTDAAEKEPIPPADPAAEIPVSPEFSLTEMQFDRHPQGEFTLWEEFDQWGTRVRGGARVRVPNSATEVILNGGEGDLSLPLVSDGESLLAQLPRRSGGPHTLELVGELVESTSSPKFWIDAEVPTLEVERVTGLGGEIEVAWSAADSSPISEDPLQLFLHLDDGSGWQQRSLMGVSPQRVPVAEGRYETFVSCRDLAGNTVRSEGVILVDVGAGGPRVLNFSTETFRGAASHYIFIDRGGVDGVVGPITIRARSMMAEGEPPLQVGVIPDVQRKLLWELPRRSGEYRLELSWSDAAGEHVELAADSFTIDADPPKVAWETESGPVSFELPLSWIRQDNDSIEDLELFRRSSEAQSWDRVELTPHAWTAGTERIRLRVNTDSWPQGAWQLGVRVSDSLGNATQQPLAGPTVFIDQQGPRVSELELVSVVAGAPLLLRAQIDEPPAVSTLRLVFDNGPILHRSVEWVQRDGRWHGTALPLPPGEGQIHLAFEDSLGNRIEEQRPVAVVAGVTAVGLDPQRPFTGDGIRVSYELRAPHPLSEPALELRLLELTDGGASQLVERLVVSRRRGTVALEAPQRPGRFAIRFVGAEALGPDLVFEVVQRSNAHLHGDSHAESAAAVSDEEWGTPVPAVATETLIVDFRNFEWAWRNKSQRPQLQNKHQRLLVALHDALQRNPDEVVIRQAAARMELFQEAPNTDAAKVTLEAGIRRLRSLKRPSSRQSSELADLLNDLAAVELRLAEWDLAEAHLLNALLLEESATRRFNLGQVYYSTRKFEEARRAFLRAIEIDPKHVGAQRAWVATVRALGAEAVTAAQRQLDQWRRRAYFDAEQTRALSLLLTGAE